MLYRSRDFPVKLYFFTGDLASACFYRILLARWAVDGCFFFFLYCVFGKEAIESAFSWVRLSPTDERLPNYGYAPPLICSKLSPRDLGPIVMASSDELPRSMMIILS